MKAVRFTQFGGTEVLEVVDLPDPHPGPGEVRIAVRAPGANPSDCKKRAGPMNRESNHAYVRSLGAEPVTYVEGVVERVRALAPEGVNGRSTSPGAVSCPS